MKNNKREKCNSMQWVKQNYPEAELKFNNLGWYEIHLNSKKIAEGRNSTLAYVTAKMALLPKTEELV